MIKWLILKVINNQINEKYAECIKQINVNNILIEEAKKCKNKEYEEDILLTIKHLENVKAICLKLLNIFKY